LYYYIGVVLTFNILLGWRWFMATVEKRVIMSIGQFIDRFVMTSEIPETKELLKESKKGIPPKLWEEFCRFVATENTIGNVAEGIARKIFLRVTHATDSNRQQVLANGRALMEEICRYARENVAEDEKGIAPDLNPARFIRIFDR